MGDMKDGTLRCFYHGWGFGTDGKCVSVPTMGAGKASLVKVRVGLGLA